jgi:hypothetical protein
MDKYSVKCVLSPGKLTNFRWQSSRVFDNIWLPHEAEFPDRLNKSIITGSDLPVIHFALHGNDASQMSSIF